MSSTRHSGYLLDTNALSALRDPQKNPQVANFLRPIASEEVFISVMTLGELRKGLEAKRARHSNVVSVERWIDEIEQRYRARIVPVDLAVGKLWGELSSDRSRAIVDTLIAATAIMHNLTLVTRNLEDMNGLPVKLLNPWQV